MGRPQEGVTIETFIITQYFLFLNKVKIQTSFSNNVADYPIQQFEGTGVSYEVKSR